MRLEVSVLCSGICEVDRGAVVGDNFAGGVVGDVDIAEVFPPAVGGDDENFVTIRVGCDGWVFAFCTVKVAEWGVGVATDDEGDAGGFFGEFNVFVVADVGEGDDTGDVFGFTEEVDGALDGGDGVFEEGVIAWIGDVWGGFGCGRNNGEFVLGEDVVGDEVAFELGVGGFNVGGYDGEGEIAEEVGEDVVSGIEFAVARLVLEDREGRIVW